MALICHISLYSSLTFFQIIAAEILSLSGTKKLWGPGLMLGHKVLGGTKVYEPRYCPHLSRHFKFKCRWWLWRPFESNELRNYLEISSALWHNMRMSNTHVDCAFRTMFSWLQGTRNAQSKCPTHHRTASSSSLSFFTTMDLCLHVVYAKFWSYRLNVAAEIETHQASEHLSSLLLCNFSKPVQTQIPVLSSQERCPVWFSAAVANLLRCLIHCIITDTLLHTLV